MSPRSSAELASKGPSALRNELAAAKKAVEVLKGEKDHTQQKLEKLHAVLEKERAALRDVLSAARKAVDDLKVEKAEVERELERVTIEKDREIERLKALLKAAEARGTDRSEASSLEVTIRTLESQLQDANRTIQELRAKQSSTSVDADELARLRAQLTQSQAESDRQRSELSRSAQEIAELQRKLADSGSKNFDEARSTQARNRMQQECALRLMNAVFKRCRESRLASALYLWAGTNVKGGGGKGDFTQEDMDNLKLQLDQQFKRLQMRLANTRKESGTRWMNQILARWRLHNVVGFLYFWKAVVGQKHSAVDDLSKELQTHMQKSGLRVLRDVFKRVAYGALGWGFTTWKEYLMTQDALSELEENKNAELRAQLAQAGRGLKKWMEEKEGQTGPELEALRLTEKALEAERLSLLEKLKASEAQKKELESELQEALQVLEKGMTELKNEKASMDSQLSRERDQFSRTIKELQAEIRALQGGQTSDLNALEWKREAERTAELFDEKKVQWDLAVRDNEFKMQLLQKQLSQAEEELAASKEELFHAVGDLAHLQNETKNKTEMAETLERRNQQLESLVTRHVVDGRVLSGNIMKQGSQISSNWHQRFCILDGAAISLYLEKPKSSGDMAKTIIPLMKVMSVKACPEVTKYGFCVSVRDGSNYRFDCENADNLKAWLSAMEQMLVANKKLTEEWEQVKADYAEDMTLLREKVLTLEQQLSDISHSGVFTSNNALKQIQNKYEILEMSLEKMDDDLFMWIERNMWRATTKNNLGFGSDDKVGGVVGGTPVKATTTVSWQDADTSKSEEVVITDEHCFANSDNKQKLFTVNFATPANSTNVQATVKMEEVVVAEPAPALPVKDTTNEVKKLQRLMTLRNPSPPRSRQERKSKQPTSPRGKSPPKHRMLNLGSLA